MGQKPVKAAKTRGMFRPPESLNSARMERMDCSENEESIDMIIRSIGALFNDSRGRNMPRVFAAFTGFWPTVRRRDAALSYVRTAATSGSAAAEGSASVAENSTLPSR